MQNVRQTLVALFFALLGTLAFGRDAAAQTGNYQLSSGQVQAVSANPGSTNVQVTPSTGTVTVTITWKDGKRQAFTATSERPLNYTRYNAEHQGIEVERIEIAYPTQPPGGHDALGRYRLQ